MGRVSAEELNEQFFNNYRAMFEDDVFEYHAASIRQAWYLAFEHFGDECVDYLAEIDQNGDVVDVILDKEDVY